MSITGSRILIVDDQAKTNMILPETLEHHFPLISVKVAKDGVEACEFLGSFHPQVIITDIVMPNMDGIAMIKFIKKDERYKDTQIIVLTGMNDTDKEIKELRDLEVTDIFYKHDDINLLVERVKYAVRSNIIR